MPFKNAVRRGVAGSKVVITEDGSPKRIDRRFYKGMSLREKKIFDKNFSMSKEYLKTDIKRNADKNISNIHNRVGATKTASGQRAYYVDYGRVKSEVDADLYTAEKRKNPYPDQKPFQYNRVASSTMDVRGDGVFPHRTSNRNSQGMAYKGKVKSTGGAMPTLYSKIATDKNRTIYASKDRTNKGKKMWSNFIRHGLAEAKPYQTTKITPERANKYLQGLKRVKPWVSKKPSPKIYWSPKMKGGGSSSGDRFIDEMIMPTIKLRK